jgi:DNA-binding NarL/FixJ family response regulator
MARVRVEVWKLQGMEIPEDLTTYRPIVEPLTSARQRFATALELYERLGDRRGVMLAIISLAYSTWGAEGAFGSAKHLEAIRRLNTLQEAMTSESERARGEAELLYSIHVYGRATGAFDLALARGTQAYQAAREVGDRGLEFNAAGGLAQTHLSLDETEEASRWIDRAAAAAAAEPTPLRARQLEIWRGRCAGRSGDAATMIQHLERAAALATEQGRPAARAEAQAWLALATTRLFVDTGQADLGAVAERAIAETRELAATLPGLPRWGSLATAAQVALLHRRGEVDAALEVTHALIKELGQLETRVLFVEPTALVAHVLADSPDPGDRAIVTAVAAQVVGFVAERTEDADVLRRWLAVPEARELTEIAGGVEAARQMVRSLPDTLIAQRLPVLPLDLDPEESALMRLMMEGRTDAEIGRELSLDEAEVSRQLAAVFAKIGAPSRSVATLYAFMADIV